MRQNAIAAGVLLIAASGYAYFRHQGANGEELLTERVTRGTVAATVTANGIVNPVTSVQVGTYVSGPIKAIYADYNSQVTEGQLVAKIDPAPFLVKVMSAEAAVANARARVSKARADLQLKKLTLERNRQLLAKNLISQNDLDTAKSSHDQAVAQLELDQASVKQSSADLESARINLAYTDIKSPVEGVVVSRSVDVGQTVAASFQTPTLFLIAKDLTKMQVDTAVSESDIGGIKNDLPVTFHVDAYPAKDFHGKVVQVRNAPTTVQNVVTYDVVIGVENPGLELRPGMTATVTIITAKRDDVLRVPLRALRFRPGERRGEPPAAQAGGAKARARLATQVFVVEPNRSLKPVAVQLGIRDERYAEVVAGDVAEKDVLAVAYKQPEASATDQRRPASSYGGGGRRPF